MKSPSAVENPDPYLDAARSFLAKHQRVPLEKVDAEVSLQLGPGPRIAARIGLRRQAIADKESPQLAAKKVEQLPDAEDELYPLPAGLA